MGRPDLRYAPSLIVAGLVLLGIFVLVQLVVELREILAVLFIGVVLGVSLSPMAGYLTRFRVPRAASVLSVYLVIAGLVVLLVWFSAPEIGREVENLPDTLETLRADYEELERDSRLPPIENLEDYGRRALEQVAPSIVSGAVTAVSVLAYALTILVVAVFYTQVDSSAKKLFLSLLPARHGDKASDVLAHIGQRLRRFMLGELLGMTIVGVIVYVGLKIMDVPFPFLLAVIAFATEILPIIGPWLGFVPALVIAATQGWETMVIVSVFYLVLQQLESNVIQPVVQKKQTELPAIVVLSSVLIGGTVMGLLGALAALPLAIIIQTVVMDVVVPWRQRQNGTEPEAAGTMPVTIPIGPEAAFPVGDGAIQPQASSTPERSQGR